MANSTRFLVFFMILSIFVEKSINQQCQCIPTTSDLNCLGYDSKLQAATLDEAIATFPDLSLDDAEGEDPTDVGCLTDQCQDCRKDLRKQLQKVGLLAQDINSILLTQTDNNSTCTKYRFSQEKQQKQKESKNDDEDDDDDSSSEEKEKQEKLEKKQKKEEKEAKKHKKDRKKRQATPISQKIDNSTVIGTRFTISCTTKGITVDPTGTVSLCSSCWVWRKLPDNYSPQYINELVCDTSDDSCLSGYAQCSVGTRTFEAVRTDNGVNTRVVLSAGSYCECRIPSTSSLQSLVAGSGISGTFTPQAHNLAAGV